MKPLTPDNLKAIELSENTINSINKLLVMGVTTEGEVVKSGVRIVDIFHMFPMKFSHEEIKDAVAKVYEATGKWEVVLVSPKEGSITMFDPYLQFTEIPIKETTWQ